MSSNSLNFDSNHKKSVDNLSSLIHDLDKLRFREQTTELVETTLIIVFPALVARISSAFYRVSDYLFSLRKTFAHRYSEIPNLVTQAFRNNLNSIVLRPALVTGLIIALIIPNAGVAFAEEIANPDSISVVEEIPVTEPTEEPTVEPTTEPSVEPSLEPSPSPSEITPSEEPTIDPSPSPSLSPTLEPIVIEAPANLSYQVLVEGIKLTWEKSVSTIDKYVVTVGPENRTIDVNADLNELLLTDLNRKAAYSFSVTAVVADLQSSILGPLELDLATIKFPRPPMNAEVGGLIVKFNEDLTSQQVTTLADTSDLTPVSLEVSSEISTDTRLVEFNQPVNVATAQEIADSLEASNSVEFAELDFAFNTANTDDLGSVVPNDPLYATKQWSLWGNFGVGIADGPTGLAKAYQSSTGLGVTVAVIDTGFTNHPDLEGQFVSGYDFVSNNEMLSGVREENGTTVPYDGDYVDESTYGAIGWDNNPLDPGDWNSTRSSSWHGTHIAGLIAALTNNGIGIAGIAPDAKIQPIRAFSWRGGLLSDVIASITWASGGTVENVPDNQTPAKVINLSFSVEAPCTPSLQLAIDDAIARGSVVVAAAGNNNQDAANFAPGNCNNVITVGAIDADGDRASYSNFGEVIDISAPGGEISGEAIYSTSNEGTTTSTVSTYAVRQGTSIATAQVSAALAKLAQTNPTENAVQLRARVLSKESVRPFTSGACLIDENCGLGYLFFGISAPGIYNLGADVSYTEDAAAITALSDFTLSNNSQNYSGQSLTLSLESPYDAGEVLNFAQTATPDVTSGVISILNGTVFKGDGTTASAIGNIDGTSNGVGKALKVNFTNEFTNGDFSSGSTGWTVTSGRVYLNSVKSGGVQRTDAPTIGGFSPPQDKTWGPGNSDTDLASAPNTTSHSFASGNLTMTMGGGSCVTGFCVLRGPYVVSNSSVYLTNGDSVSFDWSASASGDGFDVYGYLLNVATGKAIKLIDETGRDSSNSGGGVTATMGATRNTAGYFTSGSRRSDLKTYTAGSSSSSTGTSSYDDRYFTNGDAFTPGNYKFVFIAGSYDDSGGQYLGATFTIDNVAVSSSSPATINSTDIQSLVRQFTYSNSKGLYASRVLRFESSLGGTESSTGDSKTITVTQINDNPTLASISPKTYTDTSAFDDFTNHSATLSGTDEEGGTLTYGLTGATVSGSTATLVNTYGTLTLNTSTGAFTFAPNDNAINSLVTTQTQTFIFTVSDGVNSSTQNFVITFSGVTDALPSAPTIDSITAGNASLSVNFTAPSSAGTSAITNYKYSTDGTNFLAFSPAQTTTPLVIQFLSSDGTTPLSNGTTYPVTIQAVNSTGPSVNSNSINAAPAVPVATSGGSTSTPTPTPTPTPTASIRPNNLITNPLLPIPTPTPQTTNPTLVPGISNGPRQLVIVPIENLINALRPIVIDLFTNPTPQATSAGATTAPTFSNQQALSLIGDTQDKKVVDLPSLVLYNNEFQPSKLVIVENTVAQVVSPGGGLLNVEAKDGQNSVPVDNRGRVQMVRSNNVETEGTGMAPNSEFAVYLFSDPILLGIGKTDAQGKFFASFPVTNELPIGDHTLQVNGLLPDGRATSVSLPVIVVDTIATAKNQAMPKTIFVDVNPVDRALRAVYWMLIVLAVMVFLIGASYRDRFFALVRRRKDDEEDVQPAL